MARPRKYVVCLTDEEVERIQKKAKRKNTSATIKDRCNILLDMDINHSPSIKYKFPSSSDYINGYNNTHFCSSL